MQLVDALLERVSTAEGTIGNVPVGLHRICEENRYNGMAQSECAR
jgi:hypothetical protein